MEKKKQAKLKKAAAESALVRIENIRKFKIAIL